MAENHYAFTQVSEGNKKKNQLIIIMVDYIRPPLNFATEFFSNRW